MLNELRGWGEGGLKRVAGLRLVALGMLVLLAMQMKAQSAEDGAVMPADSAAAEQGTSGGQAGDPPLRAVRISVLQGAVSVEPASVNQFGAAEVNQVLTTGDRVYTDPNATAELEAGQIGVRLGGGADVTVTAMTDQLAQFGLASGSVHLRSFGIVAGTVLELDSPEAAITALQPGDVRVDEDADAHVTTVSVLSGQVQVDGPGISQQMNAGDRLRIHAADPMTGLAAYAEPLPPGGGDELDGFSAERDSLYANGAQSSSDYLNAETTGAADLASNGSWDASGDYGPVWYPVVAVGWRPYCYGHWAWVAPWGWTWVGAEPWGFAPFHYGRWIEVDGRWGWLPGTRANKPVYAPALVAFVGGRQFSASLGYGAGGGSGSGLAAWFPLGPREPYAPWYHGSTLYLNRVNASNIYDPNVAEARAFYNQRAVNVYVNGASGNLANRGYLNRASGTVAVPETSFAAGQAVARNQIRVPAAQLAEAPLLPHPMVSPERSMVVRGQARAVPAQMMRPALAAREAGREPGPGVAGEGAAAGYVNRPAFVHAQRPPEMRPGFEEQRQTMQRTDPGRPLGPEQVNNLRQNRPAGPAVGREAVPHPAPAPARAAEPARAAPAAAGPRH